MLERETKESGFQRKTQVYLEMSIQIVELMTG